MCQHHRVINGLLEYVQQNPGAALVVRRSFTGDIARWEVTLKKGTQEITAWAPAFDDAAKRAMKGMGFKPSCNDACTDDFLAAHGDHSNNCILWGWEAI